MLRFVIKRLLMLIPVLLGVMLFVFIISRASGDPVAGLLGENYTQDQYDAMREKLGLNASYPMQFFTYVKNVVTKFDLGISYATKRPVSQEITSRLPLSMRIAFISVAWSSVLGTLLGIITAVRQYSPLDYSVTTLSMIFASMPGFWVSLMLMLLFSLALGLLPATGLSSWKGYILPCISLGMHPITSFCRMTRSTMLEVIRQDYIRTARSKGLGEIRVIVKHALQNASIPVVTLLGTQMTVLIGNAAVAESIFNIPGVGSYMITAIGSNDYPAVQGSVLVFSLVVCVVTLIVDILYGFIDPRIKAKYIESSRSTRIANRMMMKSEKGVD